jgi:hypothetical protein
MTGTSIPSGGCIRLYDDGPEWHIDPHHQTVGLFDISHPPRIDSSGFLVIDLVNPDGSGENTWPVVMMAANPDETLVTRWITGGCSNGGPIMRIRLVHKDLGPLDLTRPDHYAIVAGKYSNLWPEAEHLQPAPV